MAPQSFNCFDIWKLVSFFHLYPFVNKAIDLSVYVWIWFTYGMKILASQFQNSLLNVLWFGTTMDQSLFIGGERGGGAAAEDMWGITWFSGKMGEISRRWQNINGGYRNLTADELLIKWGIIRLLQSLTGGSVKFYRYKIKIFIPFPHPPKPAIDDDVPPCWKGWSF